MICCICNKEFDKIEEVEIGQMKFKSTYPGPMHNEVKKITISK